MSIGQDSYSLLERSAAALNGVQSQFRFGLTSLLQRQSGTAFCRSRYTTSEIWNFLREHKRNFGGNRPYIIAFVRTPLESSKLSNIFGSHEAAEGLAVVTIFGAGQYVKEESRYCCYYLTRYCLSFVNPLIKGHSNTVAKDCYFNIKLYKPEIRDSMDSGYVCDECVSKLDNPPVNSVAKRLSDNEREALTKMRQYVSGDLPYAIVMKGGGVKGLAFAGALLELEKHFWFDRHVGTSAGAIAAVLLAAMYTPSELKGLLLEKDFRDFKDAPAWQLPINLLFRQGCYPGKSLQNWIAERIGQKFDAVSEVPISVLKSVLIYASRRGVGTIRFDSVGERKEVAASFAVRCSMSIPFFFFPAYIDGRRVFDGGLRNNFPLKTFLEEYPRSNFIALYLGKPDSMNQRRIGSELLDIVLEGEERKTVDDNIQNVVVMDTSPVGTIDFRMGMIEKQFLLDVGRAAALNFLYKKNLDDGPDKAEVDKARLHVETSRVEIYKLRRKRRYYRLSISGLFLLISVGACLIFRKG